MNMNGTQAEGLQKLVDGLTPPPKEHDAEVREHPISPLPHIPTMHIPTMQDFEHIRARVNAKIQRLSRLDDLVSVAEFIKSASLVERKHIINELMDTDPTGDVTGLEDYACALTTAIERISCNMNCKCDSCVAARSDEHFDRRRDGLMMGFIK